MWDKQVKQSHVGPTWWVQNPIDLGNSVHSKWVILIPKKAPKMGAADFREPSQDGCYRTLIKPVRQEKSLVKAKDIKPHVRQDIENNEAMVKEDHCQKR